MPDSGWDDMLDMLPSLQIRSKRDHRGAAIGMELQHFNRISEIEVEHFVGIEDMHLGECSSFEEIVDSRAHGPHAARKIEGVGGGVSAAEVATLNRVRLQIQQCLDFVGGHGHRC